MPFVTVGTENGSPIELRYEDRGTGRPVVLIHGWPLSSRAWEQQITPLVDAGYRVITYDRRGFGESTQTWGGYDYDTFAADLNALLIQLDLTEATLVGSSSGGGEVARYLATYGPARIASAVLASAVPPFLQLTTDNPDGGLDDGTIGHFIDGITGDRIAFLDQFATMFFSAGSELKVSEHQHRYARGLAETASPKGTADSFIALATTDFRDDLAKVTVPTLILHGDSDGVVPFAISGKRSADTIPGSELVVIEGGPHGINVSHADEFNQALLTFLSR
jgi:non-heme chloroperoxidase